MTTEPVRYDGMGSPVYDHQEPTETSAEQRARILLDAPDAEAWEYDLALALGYQPESWDGMWKLTFHPFTILPSHRVVVEEVVSSFTATEDRVTKLVDYPLPEGWRIATESRLTEPVDRLHVIPPDA
jgi:hypothetical protein